MQKQNLTIQFAAGIDTKTDPKQVIAGKLLTLENGIFVKKDEIRKRYGFDQMSNAIENSTTTISSGQAVAAYNNELLTFANNEAYSYSASTMRNTDKGPINSIDLTVQTVVANSYQQQSCDEAFHPNGLRVAAWQDSQGGSRFSVIDSKTNQTIIPNALLGANAVRPKCSVIGNYALIFYFDTTTFNLYFISIPAVNPLAYSTATSVASDVHHTNYNYDVCTGGARVYVTYNTSSASIGTFYLNSFLSESATTYKTGEVASACAHVNFDSVKNEVWVAYYNGTAAKYLIWDYNLDSTAILGPTTIETVSNVTHIISYVNGGSANFFYDISASPTYNTKIRTNTGTDAGTVGTAATLLRSVGIASRTFFFNSKIYFLSAFQSPLQPTYFLIDQFGNIVGKLAPSLGGGLLVNSSVPNVYQIAPGQFLIPYLQKDLLSSISGQIYTQTGVFSAVFNFESESTYQRAELGNNLLLSGAIVTMYDGVSFTEFGFNVFPEGVALAQSTGGNIADGTYEVTQVYAWTDAQGQIHRSAPSIPMQIVVTGGSGTASIISTIPTLRLTQKQARSPVVIETYRTLSNGTNFFLTSSITSPTLNSTTADTVTFTDLNADSTIQGNPFLYTTGGVLDNTAPPALASLNIYNDRIIGVPCENRSQYVVSKQVVPGSPVEFSDALAFNVDTRGGDIIGFQQMDTNCVILKQTLVYVFAGQGPDATGNNNDYTTPQLIVTDGGLLTFNSVVVMPLGIMFRSQRGIILLDRSLSSSFIGAEVDDYNDANILSSTLVASQNQVRFALDTGQVLVYDYFFQQWSVFTNIAAVDSTLFENLYTWINSNGQVFQETVGSFRDNGNFIKLKLVTSNLSFAGIVGFQRLRRLMILGQYINPHQLLVQMAYDFSGTFVQQDYIDAGAIYGINPPYGGDSVYGSLSVYGGAYPQYLWRIRMNQQKCTSIQISIEDIQEAGFGENLSLSTLSFEIGVKAGLYKLPAGQSYG